jgi:prolyl-tRNA synthetase
MVSKGVNSNAPKAGGQEPQQGGRNAFAGKKDPIEHAVFKRYLKNSSQFSDWFTAILKDAELIDTRYPAKGFFTHRPWSVKAMMSMYRIYEAELERTGHEPAWFPAVVPKSSLQTEAEHLEGFVPQVFWITQIGDERLQEPLALRPTSETIMYQVYKNWINGLKDLPLKIYQSCQVWRAEQETRAFIRGREFYWIEAHDVFATRQEAVAQVAQDMEMSENVIHGKFGIPLLFVKRPSWDTFPGAEYTYAADTLMPDGKVLQLPSTHLLGQKFSKAFGIKFTNAEGKEEHAWQTCYGPAIWRIFGALVAVHGDERGLRFPFELAPVQVVIVPIRPRGNESPQAVMDKCHELKERLSSEGFRVLVDDSDSMPGFKYNHWEMKGVPVRLEVGIREMEASTVTLASRVESSKQTVAEAGLEAAIRAVGGRLNETLRTEADDFFNSRSATCNTIEELREQKDMKGIWKIPFCSITNEAGECADRLKAEFEMSIRGTRVGVDEKPPEGTLCVGGCGREATTMVYAAKRY